MEEIKLFQSMLESQKKIINIHKSIAQDMCNIRDMLKMREKTMSKNPLKMRKPRKQIPDLSSKEHFFIPTSSSVNLPTLIIDTTCDVCDTISTINTSTTTSSVNPYDVLNIESNVIIDANDMMILLLLLLLLLLLIIIMI